MNLWWLLLVPVGPMLFGATICGVIWLFNWNHERTDGAKATVEGGSYRQWFVFWSTYPALLIGGILVSLAATAVPWIGAFAA